MIRVRLQTLKSSGGQTVALNDSGVWCVLGANNVGKSRLLREIYSKLASSDAQTRVLAEMSFSMPIVSEHEVESLLKQVGTPAGTDQNSRVQYVPVFESSRSAMSAMSASLFRAHYDPHAHQLGNVRPFFGWLATAGSLSTIATSRIERSYSGQIEAHPLLQLFQDGELEDMVSEVSNQNFGLPLTLDRVSGDVCLRVGRVNLEPPAINRPTLAYSNAVRSLPPLDSQGDGVKSFLGLVLAILAGKSQILLIDEPEAFLHPAQARALGRWLGEQSVRRDIQVIAATHDRDFLLGLLDAHQASVHIVRIDRSGDQNNFEQLPPDRVREVWNDPLFRYSNILQGLFHERVVICEGDADCRLYGAVVDDLAAGMHLETLVNDLLFVPSGGKHRVAKIARALSSLGVHTEAILDFDALREKSIVAEVVRGVGSDWSSEMNAKYVVMASAMNRDQAWDRAKNEGLVAVPKGAATVAAQGLLAELTRIGVYIAPVGEIEDFDRTLSLKSAAFVSAMLEASAHRTNRALRTFLQPLVDRPSKRKAG